MCTARRVPTAATTLGGAAWARSSSTPLPARPPLSSGKRTGDLDERAALAALRQGGTQLARRHGVPVGALGRLQGGYEVAQVAC
jgi:hypothetical protein